MTYPINVNIPAAGNDPADDQPPMMTNFANINSYVQVDHTNPAATGAGTHKQVSFGSNNPPSFPIAFPTLFSNTQDGAGNNLTFPELFFYTGNAGASQNQYVSTANGSVLLTGGIIMKWGSPGLVGTPFTFPVAFPNACFVVIVVGSSAAYTGGFIVTAKTASTFTVTRTSGSGNTGYYYIAIGN